VDQGPAGEEQGGGRENMEGSPGVQSFICLLLKELSSGSDRMERKEEHLNCPMELCVLCCQFFQSRSHLQVGGVVLTDLGRGRE
jgi:hypothetical protein